MPVPKWNDGSTWNQQGSVWGPLFDAVSDGVRLVSRAARGRLVSLAARARLVSRWRR